MGCIVSEQYTRQDKHDGHIDRHMDVNKFYVLQAKVVGNILYIPYVHNKYNIRHAPFEIAQYELKLYTNSHLYKTYSHFAQYGLTVSWG